MHVMTGAARHEQAAGRHSLPSLRNCPSHWAFKASAGFLPWHFSFLLLLLPVQEGQGQVDLDSAARSRVPDLSLLSCCGGFCLAWIMSG